MKKLMIMAAASVALQGCKSTPAPVMPLPAAFEQQAQLSVMQRPVVTIRDDAFHQPIGPFQLTDMDLSGKSMHKSQTGSDWQTTATGGLLFQLIFHDNVNVQSEVVNRYNTRGEQSFSFAISAANAPKVQTECQIQTFGHSSESADNPVNSYNWQTSEQSLSYLACRITQQGQVSELTIERPTGARPVLKLHQGSTALPLTPVLAAPELAAYQWTGSVGYLLGQAGQTQAAVQFDMDQPRLWLDKQLPVAQQQWLLAVMVSLQMYEWQDQQWPVNQP
jgi:hypothetical protein